MSKEAEALGQRPEPEDPDEPLPEYDFRGGVRGKYAARYAAGSNVVVLDPDVSAVFPDAGAVNDALRALIGIIQRSEGGARRAS
jgi:hypothetical protein